MKKIKKRIFSILLLYIYIYTHPHRLWVCYLSMYTIYDMERESELYKKQMRKNNMQKKQKQTQSFKNIE